MDSPALRPLDQEEQTAAMSLREIFDVIWNYPIPWLWILGGIAAVYGIVAFIILIIGLQIRKDEKNAPKP